MPPEIEAIKHIGDWVDGKLVCRPDCPSITHVKTPEDEREYDEDEHRYCPRCFEDWIEEDIEHKGTKVPSDCEECGVCSECEHLLECSKSN